MAGYDRKVVLPDGSEYYGYGFGGCCDSVCEIVFNTSMVGYQEIISDAANTDKLVVMTYPLIGNCGIVDDDLESKTPMLGGLIVREYNDWPSNFRYTKTLAEILEEDCVPAISGVDTRKLARYIRDNGTQTALITDASTPLEDALERIKNTPLNHDAVSRASCKKKWYSRTSNHVLNIVVLDCGVKLGTIRNLNQRGCNVTVFPYDTPVEVISAVNPDGVIISSGPGAPEDIPEVISFIKKLDKSCPLFGIGLGCNAIAAARGASNYKMKFGHHGDNHPVMNLLTNKMENANQNHDYCIDEATLAGTGLSVAYRNVLDSTIEGIISDDGNTFGQQYYYDISPVETPTSYLFDCFLNKAKGGKN